MNNAGTRVKLNPNQILPSTNLQADEVQVNYARLEPGDELKRIILRAEDVKTREPLKLNGEYTLAMRPDDSGNIAKVQVTQGGECGNFTGWCCSWIEKGHSVEQLFMDDALNNADSYNLCVLWDRPLTKVK